MDIRSVEQAPEAVSAEAVVIGVHDDSPLEGAALQVDQAGGGTLSRLLKQQEIVTTGLQATPLLAPAGMAARQVLVIGLGPRSRFTAGMAYRAAASAARALSTRQRKSAAFFLGHDLSASQQEHLVAGAMVGCHGADLYRRKKDRHPIDRLLFGNFAAESLEAGRILGEAINLTRRLVNEPAQELHPESFAAVAERTAAECGMEIEIWDRRRLADERCGALLAVARGSQREPRLVILRYRGGGDRPAVALAGKGVTFDSGGLSLKPTDNMKTMKADMAGAATVLGAMQAIARLRLPVNVTGYLGLVENMTGGDAYKLGDVLTARNGTTIEVLNTDAEGRLVLADVLCLAVDQRAERILDVATLTGACVVALGTDVAGLMTNDQAWCDRVASAAADCGEPVWQLPMFEEYAESIRSGIADFKNVGDGRWAGAITAAKFLEQFVGGTPWTHVDIAGPAFAEKPKPWLDPGGTGFLVRTLVRLFRE